ncbi:MAG TPA: type II toxin-antitoxin system RelE/ParE family toxin [Acidobacteriaceae bacterium]
MAESGRIRVFQTKVFARLARAEGVEANWLIRCVTEAEDGLIEANLGRGLIKQRLARPGQGKSGSLRTIVVFRKGSRAIFIDIFAKKDKANFTEDELKGYRKLAGILLSWDNKQISNALAAGTLIEITKRDGVKDGKEAQRSPRRGA